MRSFGILLTALSLACADAQTPAPAAKAAPKAAPLPALKKNGAVTQMMVDGKPFLMLAGELHNSSASSIEYMKPVWNKLSDLRLEYRNRHGVLGTIDEGRFEKGMWIPGRRLNGDEFHPNLRAGAIGMLKVKLYRHD